MTNENANGRADHCPPHAARLPSPLVWHKQAQMPRRAPSTCLPHSHQGDMDLLGPPTGLTGPPRHDKPAQALEQAKRLRR